MAHIAIAKAVDLSAPSVTARIQRLEREGYIQKYAAVLAPEKIGQGLAAFIRVGTRCTTEENSAFEQFMRDEPEILECHDVDGEDCYILKVRTETPQSLRGLISRLRRFPQVTRTTTSIALLTIKEAGTTAPLARVEHRRSAPEREEMTHDHRSTESRPTGSQPGP